jgi:hypothetical protein
MIGGLSPDRVGMYLFTTMFRPALGPTQPTIQWVPGALSLRVKQLWCEANHSPPSSVKVKNVWNSFNMPSGHGAQLKSTGTTLPLHFISSLFKETAQHSKCSKLLFFYYIILMLLKPYDWETFNYRASILCFFSSVGTMTANIIIITCARVSEF